MQPILRVKNLSVSFNNQKVVEDINFDVQQGESLAIIGPNGAGKTVLLRALLELVPYQGEIQWQPGAKIAYVPQKIDFDRYLPLSLGDFLNAKIKIQRLPQKEIGKNLDIVGFTENNLKASMGHLSFGQFQKALMVFALIGNPEVIILDEPTLGVDAPYENYIYEVIRRLEVERNLTVILVSHEFEIVYRYAKKVLCLNKNRVCYGVPQEALTDKNLAELYKDAAHYHHTH